MPPTQSTSQPEFSHQPAMDGLLTTHPVASLGVLEDGFPAVSLVPFCLLKDPLRFYSLLSGLAAHTQALQADSRCSLLIHADPSPEDPQSNHALPRMILKGSARWIDRAEAEKLGVTEIYLQKYEIAAMLLDLADFQFVEITPATATWIQGFGGAFRLHGPNWDQAERITGR